MPDAARRQPIQTLESCQTGTNRFQFELRTAPFWTSVRLIVLAAALFVIAVPLALIAQSLASNPTALSALASDPHSTIQAALGMTFWIVLWGWPAKRCVDDLWRRRTITIDAQNTVIADRNIVRSTRKTLATPVYLGLVRHLRTSPSGTRYDVIVIHPNPALNLRLLSSPTITSEDVASLANKLGLSVIPASHLYRLPDWRQVLPGVARTRGTSTSAARA